MSPTFIKKLGSYVRRTEVIAQKINSSSFKIFVIVIVSFSRDNKIGRPRLFEEIFVIANISIDIAFGMTFLTLNNIEINFSE